MGCEMKSMILSVFLFLMSSTYALETNIDSCEKVYISAEQLAVNSEGIFIYLEDTWFQTDALFSDADGFFITAKKLKPKYCADGYIPCRNCDRCVPEKYDICPVCLKPTRS